jgi:quercetin dioxygenase-like cupin family protein
MTWCRIVVLGLACFVVGMLALADTSAQTEGVQVKPVIVAPLTGVDGKEMVVLNLTIAPGAASPIHTHPGDCVGMVTEGTVELLVQGKEPQRVTAGDIVRNLRGTVHGFRNVGNTPARLTNVLVVDKDKPRIVPRPMSEAE